MPAFPERNALRRITQLLRHPGIYPDEPKKMKVGPVANFRKFDLYLRY